MNNNLSSCSIVTFAKQESTAQELADFLDEYFEVTACNYTEDGKEEYVGYAQLDFNPQDLKNAAEVAGIILPDFTVERLENKNWLTENVIKFAPIDIAQFCIYGIHEQQPPKTDKVTIKVYAATAFGSGHQTTKSCLRAISDLDSAGVKHRKILDMGTGSGILSLACAKLWSKDNPEIIAVDIDDEAVRVTTQNAFDNNLEQYLSVAQSDGYNSDLVQNSAPYDIIIANILARPLIEMAPDLAKHLKTGGFCILSGFVDNQIEWVVSEHEKYGLKCCKIYDIDNWHAVLMEKM